MNMTFAWSTLDINWAILSPFGKAFTPIHLALVLVITCIVFGVIFMVLHFFMRRRSIIDSTDLFVKEATAYQQTSEFIRKLKANQALDAIFVCGGGRPSTVTQPPLYVQSRCDISVLLYKHSQQHFGKDKAPKILCLSAGTAHTPQLLHKATKLPVWESYSSAQYILSKYKSFVEPKDVFMETVSYDTIGNAYFAKMLFSDILKWRNIAVITNDWHFDRTKAIFEWIYSMKHMKRSEYNMIFVNLRSNENKDLSGFARNERMEREQNSLEKVYKLQRKYNTLSELHGFLFTEHSMYACSKTENTNKKEDTSQETNAKLMSAYGFDGKDIPGDNVNEMFENIKKRHDKNKKPDANGESVTI